MEKKSYAPALSFVTSTRPMISTLIPKCSTRFPGFTRIDAEPQMSSPSVKIGKRSPVLRANPRIRKMHYIPVLTEVSGFPVWFNINNELKRTWSSSEYISDEWQNHLKWSSVPVMNVDGRKRKNWKRWKSFYNLSPPNSRFGLVDKDHIRSVVK